MITDDAQRLADKMYVLLQGRDWPTVQLALSLSALQYETNEERRKKALNQPDE